MLLDMPSCTTARSMSRSPNSWMRRQCLEGELDGEHLIVADPLQLKSTTWSDKVVTLKQKLQLEIFVPTSSFWFNFELNFEFNFGTILA